MRIAIIGGARFGIAEPHAGGLERVTHDLAHAYAVRGHDVTVFAGDVDAPTPNAAFRTEPISDGPFTLSEAARADVSMPPARFVEEHHAYLQLEQRIRDGGFDVVHNNSLHYVPVLSTTAPPTVHTLHTPPTPFLESAHRLRSRRTTDRVVSVSHDNAARWNRLTDAVVHNGIDLDRWDVGRGNGGYVVWSGRIVPEKAPHLAMDAARRARRHLVIAGPVHDVAYFESMVMPRLDPSSCTYVGHRDQATLSGLLRSAAVALVSPVWDEPFGLVVIEALASGTPVAAFGRGAVPELVDGEIGCVVPPGDVGALSDAIGTAELKCRRACRRAAENRFSVDAMADRYEALFASCLGHDELLVG